MMAGRRQIPIGQLGKGFGQRVGLAQAILHYPKPLILDEPTQIVKARHLDAPVTPGVTWRAFQN